MQKRLTALTYFQILLCTKMLFVYSCLKSYFTKYIYQLWCYALYPIVDRCYNRGRGPLKSTMDVINAAKKISEAGTKLDALANKIADQVIELFIFSNITDKWQEIWSLSIFCKQCARSVAKCPIWFINLSETSIIDVKKTTINIILWISCHKYLAI